MDLLDEAIACYNESRLIFWNPAIKRALDAVYQRKALALEEEE